LPADPYVYPGTSCLRNRLGIHDAVELERSEAARTSVTLALIARNPLPGNYDLTHLQAFHRRIFSDIYEWAGELRSVAIAKDDNLFALPQHLDAYLDGLFEELAGEAFLRGLDRDQFLERLTHYHAELNAAHPFREGNGRTQRAFLGQLARDAGYTLVWHRLDRDRNIDAARASHRGDNAQLREMLAELLAPLT
jgi:cell filamentation protein